ncbi:hypothetical protein OROHE_009888 [Orobanche hederae]
MESIIHTLSITLFFAFILSARPTFSADSSGTSPSPSPHPPTDDISPPPFTPSPSPAVPKSPPAPPPSDLAPNSPSPAPSPGNDDYDARKKSTSPAPVVAGDVSHEDQSRGVDLETKDDSSGGMSGGKKTGVAIGVIAAVCIVGVGALVYKKRQRNIQRPRYGYAGRREML